MPLLTHALFYAGYALAALTIGLAVDQIGGGGGFLSGVAIFAACAITHAGFAASHAAGLIGQTERKMRAELDRLRAAHREIAADMDAMVARMEEIDQRMAAIGEAAPRLAHAPGQELAMIDQIVDKLSRSMDARFHEMRRLAGPSASDARASIDIVRAALIDNRVELHLQPIVSLPQRRTVFYEGFTRLKDESGRLILPQEFIPAAEQAGLMALIDRLLLFRCVQIVRKLTKSDRRMGIFCNVSLSALADEQFFPQFLAFMHEHRDLAGSIVFEIPQSAFERRTSLEARAMMKLGELGFRFSIDKVARIDIDLPDLERSNVRYLKIPGRLMIEQMIDSGMRPSANIARDVAAKDVAAICARYGVDLIAERIETEDAILELLDLDVPYAQGHLFGAPRAVKESLMEETAPPPEFLIRARSAA